MNFNTKINFNKTLTDKKRVAVKLLLLQTIRKQSEIIETKEILLIFLYSVVSYLLIHLNSIFLFL
jgi:hypothetical protein